MAQLETPILFDDKIALLGYEWVGEAGRPLSLVSYWEIVAPVPPDLVTFVHLMDENEQLRAQFDGLDAVVTTLPVGDRFVQLHPLGEVMVGESDLVYIGLYVRGQGVSLRTGSGADKHLLVEIEK